MKKICLMILLSAFLLNFVSCKEDTPDDQNDQDSSGFADIMPDGWQAEVVDSSEFELATFNKIAVDKNNGVHIIYTKKESSDYFLKYAYKSANGTWEIENISDLVVNEYVDITISEDNKVYVVFTDQNQSGTFIKYKDIGGSAWQQIVLSNDYRVRYASIITDENNQLHVAYARSSDGTYYAKYDGTDFENEFINDYAESRNEILIDKYGKIHIFAAHNENIYHSVLEDTIWNTSIIISDANYQNYTQLSGAIDTMGNISIVYELDATGGGFAYKADAQNWNIDPFYSSSVGRISKSIDVDCEGTQYITFYASHDLYYCVGYAKKSNTSNNWDVKYLFNDEDLKFGECSSVIIDKDYSVHVSANGVTDEKLYYAYYEHN